MTLSTDTKAPTDIGTSVPTCWAISSVKTFDSSYLRNQTDLQTTDGHLSRERKLTMILAQNGLQSLFLYLFLAAPKLRTQGSSNTP